jgi:hypothetical protein
MRSHHEGSARVGKGTVLAVFLVLTCAVVALVYESTRSSAAAQESARLEASIFSYDGQDFVRTKTTLKTEDGKSAMGTKLDHASAAYKALAAKQSFTGDVTVFGHKYAANYAPLTGKDGKVTGALFVAEAK